MDADLDQVLRLLRSAHVSSADEHVQLSGLRPAWGSALADLDEPGPAVSRTGALSMSVDEFLNIDDPTVGGISSIFDGCRLWFVFRIPESVILEADVFLNRPWIAEPRVFLMPASSGSDLICVYRIKVDFCKESSDAKSLPVALFSRIEEIDALALKKPNDARSVVFRLRAGRKARLPSRGKIAAVKELYAGLKVAAIEVHELGALCEVEIVAKETMDEEGVAGCCYYSLCSMKAMLPAQAKATREAELVRIETSDERLVASYVASYLNNHARLGQFSSIDDAKHAITELPILMPRVEVQVAIAHFNATQESFQCMLDSSLSGFSKLSVVGQINSSPTDLFQASVYYDGLVEAGSRHGAGTLPYALSCAYRAYECASKELRMERAFKMIDAFVEFHCLCGISLAAAFFDKAAEARLVELYKRAYLFQLGGWREEFARASSAYGAMRSSQDIGELLRLTKVLGSACIYALDQLYSSEVDQLLIDMVKLRNTFDAHGPTWGAGESGDNEKTVLALIARYSKLTLSLWGHLRLGYCSSVSLNSSGHYEALVERCGHEGFGKSGMLFVTREKLACPGSLVLYSNVEDAVFVSLLPINHIKKIAPSLHVIYSLSRTESKKYVFNSFAALEAGISAREIIDVSDASVKILTDLLRMYPGSK